MSEPKNPLDVEEILPAPNDSWAAKRELAAEIRELSELLVTSSAEPADLRNLAAVIRERKQLLETAPRTFGRMKFYQQEGAAPHVHVELNPVCGWSNPIAPPINSWIDDGKAFGRVNMGWQYEGPPGSVHGGWVAALFDDFLGMAQRITPNPGMTGTLKVRYRKPTPLNTELELVGYVKRQEGRKNLLVGEMRANGELTAECEGLFIGFKKEARRLYEEQQPR